MEHKGGDADARREVGEAHQEAARRQEDAARNEGTHLEAGVVETTPGVEREEPSAPGVSAEVGSVLAAAAFEIAPFSLSVSTQGYSGHYQQT